MADRINGMRAELKTLLVDDLGSKQNWDHISACFARVLLPAADAHSPHSQPDRHVRLPRQCVALLAQNSRACADSPSAVSPEQVAKLVNEHHVYLTKDGRISVAGITRVRRRMRRCSAASAPY